MSRQKGTLQWKKQKKNSKQLYEQHLQMKQNDLLFLLKINTPIFELLAINHLYHPLCKPFKRPAIQYFSANHILTIAKPK